MYICLIASVQVRGASYRPPPTKNEIIPEVIKILNGMQPFLESLESGVLRL